MVRTPQCSIHKITERDVADKPRFDQIIPTLIAGFSDLPVVAHNAAFDIGAAIRKELQGILGGSLGGR